ncbi:MAG: hypothetical protein P4L98_23735, partial [Ancalomicrobiaceae bacterium]|nr:hypothetical protein [Ancalomicrobiaceae bacterium]
MDGNEARALAVLEGARAARSRPEAAEAAVLEALALAPDDLDVLTGAYKFYFYNNRLAEALPHAQAILVLAARRLNVATDWRQVHAADADFATFDKPPR